MLTISSLSFAAPWALSGFVALFLILWLLRLKPPAPARVVFPPVRLLARLITTKESPARTPWWLILLRLVLASLVILVAAQPLLDAEQRLRGQGPVYVIVDDGWAAAADWPARQALIDDIVNQANRDGRPLVIVPTAPSLERSPPALQLANAADARSLAKGLQPKPWSTNRRAAIDRLVASDRLRDAKPGHVIWLADGLEEPSLADDENQGLKQHLLRLKRFGAVTLMTPPAAGLPIVVSNPDISRGTIKLRALRADTTGQYAAQVQLLGEGNEVLAREGMIFRTGANEATREIQMPAEMLNRMTRLEVETRRTAAGVILLDERWRRRPIGLLRPQGVETDQPLLNPTHYLERALRPFTEIRQGNLEDLLQRQLAVLALTDPGRLAEADLKKISSWLEKGGVVIRFAGPRLAQDADGTEDSLLPVRLRTGGRTIGGALAWRRPERLANFPLDSPFHGLKVPNDVKVTRQVLAQPALDLAEKTWAALTDGTPLVTATKRGDGWLILFHVTANAEWSNLPLSGLFVDMMRRIVDLSQGIVAGAAGPPLVPVSTLDGFGRLGSPAAGTLAIAADKFAETTVSPQQPPGLYGSGNLRRALNLSSAVEPPVHVQAVPNSVERRFYELSSARDLRPAMLAAAMVLALLDMIVSMGIRGLLPGFSRVAGAILFTTLMAGAASAQSTDTFAMGNALETRLAYILTGDTTIDETSRAGLSGLGVILHRRTAAELGPPQGVDPAVDDLVFFPLVYWPVTGIGRLSGKAARKINTYLRNGGTILFDTRDQGGGGGNLSGLARDLDIPPLIPVPTDHVLSRAFYLLKEYPGRWTGGTLWIERLGQQVNDGVSPVIAGSHDWAAAWAMDDQQRPLFPVVPGGERQREMAYRFGVNLVMYTLTGNYKADQVHLPAIIKRLGQ